jgi:CBS domain-containing protein
MPPLPSLFRKGRRDFPALTRDQPVSRAVDLRHRPADQCRFLRVSRRATESEWDESIMLTAADVMTTDVITVAPETPVRDIAQLLYTRRISSVPVVDANRAVMGLVSEGDLMNMPVLSASNDDPGDSRSSRMRAC